MKQRIIVAEDDLAMSEAMQLMLEFEDYEVEIMSRGAEVRQIDTPLPALLLLDIRLGGMDGREICRHLKSQQTTKHLPIILLSAQNEVKAMAKEAGADDFLEKPFSLDGLLNLVAKYM